MTATSVQDRVREDADLRLTLIEVMADLDPGWDLWIPERPVTEGKAAGGAAR